MRHNPITVHTLIPLALAVVALGGCTAEPACLLGLPKTVASACGCSASQQSMEVALAQTRLSQALQLKASECANASAAYSSRGTDVFSGKIDACLKKEQVLDVEIREQLIQIVKTALAGTNAKQQGRWEACYEQHLGPGAPSKRSASLEVDPSADSSKAQPSAQLRVLCDMDHFAIPEGRYEAVLVNQYEDPIVSSVIIQGPDAQERTVEAIDGTRLVFNGPANIYVRSNEKPSKHRVLCGSDFRADYARPSGRWLPFEFKKVSNGWIDYHVVVVLRPLS